MTGRQDLYDESMSLGHSAAWDQDWDRAIEFYRKALAEFPEQPDALTSLGLALLEVDRAKEALAVYNQASKADPTNPIPVEKCAEIFEILDQKNDAIAQRQEAAERYMRRKDADKAIENWTHIARLLPGDLSVRSRLALTYERLGRRNEAVHEFLAVASIMQHSGKHEGAIEATQRALGLVPGEPEASKFLRLLRQDEQLPYPIPPVSPTRPLRRPAIPVAADSDGDPFSDGFDAPEAAEESDVKDPEEIAREHALSMLAELLFEESSSPDGDEPKGLGVAAIAKGLPGKNRESASNPSMYRYLGQAIDLELKGNSEQSSVEFERSIKAGLKHPAAHYILGLQHKRMKHSGRARKNLLEARGNPELALGANLALGRIEKSEDNLKEAARYLVQALRLADSLTVDEAESTQLNRIYDSIQAQSEGDEDIAEEDLAKIVQNSLEFLTGPEWLKRIRHAREQLQEQSSDRSVVPIAEMLAVGGSERVVRALDRIDNLVELGLLTTAMEEAMLALSYSPTFLGLHQRMAEILLKNGRKDAAMEKLSVIAETNKIRGEADQASMVYRRMLRADPVDVDTRRKLIQILVQQHRIEESLEQYLELSELYRQMAQIEAARQTLGQALEFSQKSRVDETLVLRILNQIGEMDLARLDWRSAMDAYGQILHINPADEHARLNLIDLNLRLGREAEAGEVLDSYLEYLVKNRQGAKALEMLEEMVREQPGKQLLHRRLAEAYTAAGRKADAIAQYDALGEIQLDAGQVQDTIRTIQTIIGMDPPDVDGYKELLRNLTAEN